MAGGLRYEVHRMPEGMREKVVAQVLEKVSAGAAVDDLDRPEGSGGLCETYLRWSECAGTDAACPHRQKGLRMPW